MLNVQEHAEQVFIMAQKLLEEEKELSPVLLYFLPNEEEPGLMTLRGLMDGSDKDAVAESIRITSRETKAYGLITIMEAWGASIDTDVAPDDIKDLPRPSKLPERRELICVTFEWRHEDGFVQDGSLMRYFHHEGDKTVFGETITDLNQTNSQGRFARLLDGPRREVEP